jgi:hypothetical protein
LFIRHPHRTVHTPVRYANLVEFRPDRAKPELLVEAQSGHLCVQVDLPETIAVRLFDQVHHDGSSNSLAAVLIQYCDAPDLTDGVKAASANYVTVFEPGNNMPAERVALVPFLGFRHPLLDDEDLPPYGLECRAISLPSGRMQRNGNGIWTGHGKEALGRQMLSQTSLAKRAAKPR